MHDRSFFRNCGTGARRGEALPDVKPANYREGLCLPRQFSSSERSFTIKERNGWQIYPHAVEIFTVFSVTTAGLPRYEIPTKKFLDQDRSARRSTL
jgi:hypothetical protein